MNERIPSPALNVSMALSIKKTGLSSFCMSKLVFYRMQFVKKKQRIFLLKGKKQQIQDFPNAHPHIYTVSIKSIMKQLRNLNGPAK